MENMDRRKLLRNAIATAVAVDALALSSVAMFAHVQSRDNRDVQITDRLKREYQKRAVQLARDSQRR